MDFYTVWSWIQKISGVLFIVLFCLYAIRCFAEGEFLNLDQFGHYLSGLITHIFSK